MVINGIVTILILGVRQRNQTLRLVYKDQTKSITLHRRLSAVDLAGLLRSLADWLDSLG